MDIHFGMKINKRSLIISVVVIFGLFMPWITRGLDPIGEINPNTGQGELRYRRKILLSPFFVVMTEEGEVTNISWFVSSGTALAGVMLALSSVLFVFSFRNPWMKVSIFSVAFLGIVFFFMSLGTGLSIGLKTELGWGIIITLIGVGSMFIYSILELSRNPKLRIMTR